MDQADEQAMGHTWAEAGSHRESLLEFFFSVLNRSNCTVREALYQAKIALANEGEVCRARLVWWPERLRCIPLQAVLFEPPQARLIWMINEKSKKSWIGVAAKM
jgi:hypothetical protein